VDKRLALLKYFTVDDQLKTFSLVQTNQPCLLKLGIYLKSKLKASNYAFVI